MTRILHLLTKEDDGLANEILSRQRQDPSLQVQTVDLTQPQPDYPALLHQIFDADSITVW